MSPAINASTPTNPAASRLKQGFGAPAQFARSGVRGGHVQCLAVLTEGCATGCLPEATNDASREATGSCEPRSMGWAGSGVCEHGTDEGIGLVGRGGWGPAKLDERMNDDRPSSLATSLACRCSASRTSCRVFDELSEGVSKRINVAGRHNDPCAACCDRITNGVSTGRDHWPRRPEGIQEASAVRERRLEVIQVSAHDDVGLEEIRTAVVVGNPIQKEDVASGEAELVGVCPRVRRRSRLAHVGVGMPGAGEHQPHLGVGADQLRHGFEQGMRVQPVVDPASPPQDDVVRTDARHDVAKHRAGMARRLILDAERHVDEEQPEVGRCGVGCLVEPTGPGERPEPEVTLATAGRQEEVTAAQQVVDGSARGPDGAAAMIRVEGGRLLERFELVRVIEVGDHNRAGLAERGYPGEKVALNDDDIRLAGEPLKRGWIGGDGRKARGRDRSRPGNGGERHGMSDRIGGQRSRKMPGPNRGAGSARSEHL